MKKRTVHQAQQSHDPSMEPLTDGSRLPTAEEIHAMLERGIRDFAARRISTKQMNQITYRANLLLRFLDFLDRSKRKMEKETRGQSTRKKPLKAWVN